MKKTLAAVAVGAAVVATGLSPVPAEAQPRATVFGSSFAFGSNCLGKVSGYASPKPGYVYSAMVWNAWTPLIGGPCRQWVAITWRNLDNGRSGKVTRPIAYRGMFDHETIQYANLPSGPGRVRLTLTAANQIERASTIVVRVP